MLGSDCLERRPFRTASLAGIFYPDENVIVRSVLQSYGLTQNPRINARCILAPYGSWHVTGNYLALAYKSLIEHDEKADFLKNRSISKVVLLGNLHNTDETGLFLSESDYFETPLGNLMIDEDINEALMSCNTLFEMNDIPHLREDAPETHFPIIKFMFPEATFIPLLTGGSSLKMMTSLASALNVVFEPILDETLFIVSSNSAIHADPHISQRQSERFIAMIMDKNGAELLRNFQEENISVCGTVAMAALLESGLLEKSIVTHIPNSGASVLDMDNKTVCFTALNFS